MSRTIIVSGGSRGLGGAVVDHLLESGHTVATFSRRDGGMVQAWRDSYPDRFMFAECDMRDEAGVKTFVKQAQRAFGRPDTLVNNAAIARDGLLTMAPTADIDLMLGVNLRGTLLLTRAVVRAMLAGGGGGRIVNVSSIVGLRGYRGLSAYSATKAGLDGITRSLARELGPRGITVNSIAPGYLDTEMTSELDPRQRERIVRRTPLGRLGTPADVLPLLDFLLADGAGFVTGQVLVADGGISC